MGLEVGLGGAVSFGIARAPFGEEADGEPPEHAENPDSVAVADAAQVFVERGVEPLMETAFDTPVLADGVKPLGRVHLTRRAAGDQVDRLGFVGAEVTSESGDLLDMREAGHFRGGRLGVNLPSFPLAAIHLVGRGKRRRQGLRGKRPPAWRRSACARFV